MINTCSFVCLVVHSDDDDIYIFETISNTNTECNVFYINAFIKETISGVLWTW